MKLQDAKREAKLQQWREMVYQCRNSGQTVEAWCREYGIPVATYYRRQKQVWEQEKEKLPAKIPRMHAPQTARNNLPTATFEAIPCSVPRAADDIGNARIILQKGEWKLEIRNGADILLLRQILEVLG